MPQVMLDFKTDDDGLNLSGVVNFRNALTVERLHIRGLAEWRHISSNVITVSEDTISVLNLVEKSKNLAKIGVNWNGLKARSNILLPFSLRTGRNGKQKVQDQLTKFFKALGATSVKFSIVDVGEALNEDAPGEGKE